MSVIPVTLLYFEIAHVLILKRFPCRYTMVPASLYMGFAASIIWVGQVQVHVLDFLIQFHFKEDIRDKFFLTIEWAYQGTYLTSTAHSHARDNNLHEGTVIGSFNGVFWGMFACHQVTLFIICNESEHCCFTENLPSLTNLMS